MHTRTNKQPYPQNAAIPQLPRRPFIITKGVCRQDPSAPAAGEGWVDFGSDLVLAAPEMLGRFFWSVNSFKIILAQMIPYVPCRIWVWKKIKRQKHPGKTAQIVISAQIDLFSTKICTK